MGDAWEREGESVNMFRETGKRLLSHTAIQYHAFVYSLYISIIVLELRLYMYQSMGMLGCFMGMLGCFTGVGLVPMQMRSGRVDVASTQAPPTH